MKNSYNQYVIDKYGMTEVKNFKKWFIRFTYIYKLEKKRTLEKKHSPEVNSNHNEEHITNPCGFVTHIY